MAGNCDTVTIFRVLRNAGNLFAEVLLMSQESVCCVEFVTVLVSLYFEYWKCFTDTYSLSH